MEDLLEFNNVLDIASETFSLINPEELYDQLKLRPGLRPCLLALALKNLSHLRSYGPKSRMLIEPASSDEESDSESKFPSTRKVIKSILDSNMTSITNMYEPSSFQKPTLIFFHLDPRLKSDQLKRILFGKYRGVSNAFCIDFMADNRETHCGIISFNSENEAKAAYKHFITAEERGELGAILHEIPGVQMKSSVRWFVNKTLDPNNEWIGIVIRGLSKNVTKEKLRAMLGDGVVHIESPRQIQGVFCTIVALRSIDHALHLVSKLNYNTQKVCLHPSSHILKRPELIKDIIYPTRRRPRSNSATPLPDKKPKLAEAMGKLLSSIVKASPGVSTPPLVTTESGVLEDGEITETGQKRNSSKTQNETCHIIYEYPGVYATRVGCFAHSGVFIKTRHVAPDVQDNAL